MSTKIFAFPQCGLLARGKAEATDVAKCPIHEIVGTIAELASGAARGARHHRPRKTAGINHDRRDAELVGETPKSERKIRRRKRRSRRPDRASGRGVRRFPARSEALINYSGGGTPLLVF